MRPHPVREQDNKRLSNSSTSSNSNAAITVRRRVKKNEKESQGRGQASLPAPTEAKKASSLQRGSSKTKASNVKPALEKDDGDNKNKNIKRNDNVPSTQPNSKFPHGTDARGVSSEAAEAPQSGGWIRRMLTSMFSKEEFVEMPVFDEVTREHLRTFKVIDRLLPSFAKKPTFYAIDFFTHRRVIFVFLFIAVLLGYYHFYDDVLSITASFVVADENRPGKHFLKNHKMLRKHPVLIIPGFISVALEVWEDHIECMETQWSSSSSFRQRMFGPRMLFLMLVDPMCYMRLFSLDKRTGLDPEGVKVRADLGFGASDFFMPGYWVWAKVFLNLADIGYDPQSVGVFSYDWRLSPRRMHSRDGYYHYLKNHLLYLYEKNNEKVVIISHSYGTTVLLDFFRWSETHEKGWINKYVAHWINIGGTSLGVAKSVSAVLIGDAKDTLTLPSPARQVLESHLSRSIRTEAMRTWSCLTAMYPIGCDAVFPDILTLSNGTRLKPREVLHLTRDRLQESGHEAQRKHVDEIITRFDELPGLPMSPNLTVFCLYGVDRRTEVGYILGEDNLVNLTYQESGRAMNGVILGNGDGTVPLLSLGYMCRAKNGWKQNVARVITREHKENNDTNGPSISFRGGSSSGDHVDILGNTEMIETILKIVSGNAENNEVSDRIYSDIDERIEQATECASKKNKSPTPK